jgi:stearoyl-CoA desaturase (delta-9 desaturase)
MGETKATTKIEGRNEEKKTIVWVNVVWYILLHVLAAVGLYSLVTKAMWKTWALVVVFYGMNVLGVTAGAHRLWSHRSYAANLPYRIMVMLFNCVALQNDVIEWARDHRCHHKWSETDADPHNFNRGLFFCHMGWLLQKKRSEVTERGKTLDLSDLYRDPVLRFQRKFYRVLSLTCCFILPTVLPAMLWGESAWVAFLTVAVFRYVCVLHITWCVNSVAHWLGSKPYDCRINPVESWITSLLALGEGWHNYHHVFPSDYKAAELPYLLNFTTMFIDFFAWLGWTSERKMTEHKTVENMKTLHGEK